MKVSLKWLRSYVDIDLPAAEIARRLTLSTAEVEAIEQVGEAWEQVSVGQVVDITPHPNADRLRLATLETVAGTKTVVCGAPNLEVGQKIAFAGLGAQLTDGHTGKPAVLKASMIRGVESAGMVCSERELGLSDEHEGILVLSDDAPIGVPLHDWLGDTILDLYSWPHRPDLMSMIGVAREVAVLTDMALHEPELGYRADRSPVAGRLGVTIEAPELCPRYIGALIEGVQIAPSSRWLQERLAAVGMRPVSNVVDITNYVMIEFGQPLHAFDYDRVAGHQIIVRRARNGERLRTLDGEDRALDERMLVIADPDGPVALAGVMGGEASEVSNATTSILLEAANFSGFNIRATSTRLHLRSEASARFEKGIGPEVAMQAVRRAVQLMVQECGGHAADGLVDVYPGEALAAPIIVTAARIRTVLGIDVAPEDVRRTLEALGFGVEGGPPEAYVVSVPYWRTDVHLADDVIEETVRILGYESIPHTTVRGRIPVLWPEPVYQLRRRVQDILVQAGMQEVITYSLIGDALLPIDAHALSGASALRIVNPASQEHVYLRPGLRGSLLRTLSANLRQRRGRVKLFETARAFLPRLDDLPAEPEMAVGVIGGRRLDRWGMPAEEAVDFYDAKGIVEELLRRLKIEFEFRPSASEGLVVGRTAEVFSGERSLGVVGQVHPNVAERFDLQDEVYLFELSFDSLLSVGDSARGYQPYSRFPAVSQDLAVVVDDSVTAADVAKLIRQGRYVTDVRPFDVYTGAPVPAGRKSIAFAVEYQALDRTLTEEEVLRSRNRTLQQLRQQLGAELRER